MSIKNWNEITDLVNKLKNQNRRIVFTNGCFDIIHAGHVQYLQEAKALGDILIIGLNSDASVKRLKGAERPVNNQNDRAIVLSALKSVDYIVVFDEDTPYDLIKQIKPDILVKGGDWPENKIVGHDIVKANGGIVKSLSFRPGNSSTSIIEKMKNNG
ncbi:MAG: D-glycero-beta-D-manno-heptose 1-phosphate adenylyltransferase [Candidatus Cloacimonadota bacterium]|nr:MAG: D-glycero-beta-D-manno-heptose 1-phosphate adenylyltransferase [Candidatus Cloacimonadota bacterium]